MIKKYLAISAFILLALLACFVAYRQRDVDLTDQDIYYSWVEGTRIANGENPYSRIHQSNMRENDKYATYFPLFYELSALAIIAGLNQFPEWLELWRAVFLLFNLGIGLLIFLKFYAKQWYLIGLLASILWFFNRWTLFVTYVVHLDILAIFPFLLALELFPKQPKTSFVSFGFSLAIKQIAIFVVPLFVVWSLLEEGGRKLRTTIRTLVFLTSVPLLSAIPFLLQDTTGLVKSVLFSVTRTPSRGLRAIDLSSYLELGGLAARLPLLIVLVVILAIAWKRGLPKYTSAFLVMVAFTEFNPVSFSQYMAWPLALLPFVIFELCEMYHRHNNSHLKPA